jgi:hypothetical protein
MLERDHYPGLLRGAALDGWLLNRIPDAKDSGKKPFDIFGACPSGLACAIEVKRFQGLELNDFTKLLAPHQLNWLKAYAKRGCPALVPVYFTKWDEMRVYEVREPQDLKMCFRLVKDQGFWRGWPTL